MNYFSAIAKRATELDALGTAYLDTVPFMSNDKVCKRLCAIACEIDKSDKENPEWVDSTMDGYLPFGSVPRNGSLYFSLGFAVAAQDARRRNLLEVEEGREAVELTFPPLAEKDIVDTYAA